MRLKMKGWQGGVTVAPSIDLSTARSTYAYSSVHENGVHGTDAHDGAPLCDYYGNPLYDEKEIKDSECERCLGETEEEFHKRNDRIYHHEETRADGSATPETDYYESDDGFDDLTAGSNVNDGEGLAGGYREGMDDDNELSDQD